MIEITKNVLDPDEITSRVHNPSAGAIISFLGSTRNVTSYEPMAHKLLAAVADEMHERWPLHGVAISHRLGRLEIGEVSLVVAVSSQHRPDAFAACEYSVDRIKQTVPIWKKEYFEGGSVWVESPDDQHTSGTFKP